MIKYSAFYPPVEVIGVKGTALPATRNVNLGEWDNIPLNTTLNVGDTVQFYGNTFVVKTAHIKLNGTAGPDQNPNYDAYVTGAAGESLYTWIAYADSADGTVNFTTSTPGNRTYIGIVANKNSTTESTNPADYVWSKMQGPIGPSLTILPDKAGFTYFNGNLSPNPQQIVYGLKVSDNIDPAVTSWSTTPNIGGGTGANFVITSAMMGVNSQVVLRANNGTLSTAVLVQKIADPTADKTGSNTAAGIFGQKDLATMSSAQLPFGANALVNTDFTRGRAYWSAATTTSEQGRPTAVGLNAFPFFGLRNVAYMTVTGSTPWTQSGAEWFDGLFTAGVWGGTGTIEDMRNYSVPVKDGDRLFFRALVAVHRCTAIVYTLVFNKDGVLIYTGQKSGGYINGGHNGNPINFNEVGDVFTVAHPEAAYACLMVRMLPTNEAEPHVFITEPALGHVPANQTTIPPYQPGRTDPLADITRLSVSAGILNQATTATNSDFSVVTGTTKPENNADVTSMIVPTVDGNIVTRLDQLPRPIDFRLVRNGQTVTSGITWSYLVLSGTVNGLTNGNGPQTLSGGGTQSFTLSNVSANGARIRFVSVYNGTMRQLDKIIDIGTTTPSTGGSQSGGSTSQITSFASTGTGSTSYSSVNQLAPVTTGSDGTITFTAPLSYVVSGNEDGSAVMYGVWQWKLPSSGTWVDVGPEVTAFYASVRSNSSSGGGGGGNQLTFPTESGSYTEEGYGEYNQTRDGLSPNTTYDVRLLLRDNSSTRAVYASGVATAAGT